MCMETRAAVSSYTPEGKMTIYHSNQSPYYMQGLMAGVLGMREGDIRVVSPYVGGGFGGKFELDGAIFCSAILSKKCHRPVKIVYTREEDFIASKRRTPMFYYTRTGVRKDGTFVCQGSEGLHERRRIHRHGRNSPLPDRFLPLLPLQMAERLPL